MNSSISQEEIEALFGNPVATQKDPASLTIEEIDTLGEIGNISMGTAATTLCEILGRRVRITTPRVRLINLKDLALEYETPFVVVEVRYTEGLEGNNVLILKEDDVRLITSLMMGGEGIASEESLGELHLSAISETMNQMMGSAATSMSDMLGRTIQISPPKSAVARIGDGKISAIFPDSCDIVQVSFSLEIEGLANSEIMQLMPVWFGKELVNALMNRANGVSPEASARDPVPQAEVPFPQKPPAQESERPRFQPQPARAPAFATPPQRGPVVDARPVRYANFDDEFPEPEAREESLNLIIDVPLQVTIELGKCKKTVKEILEFNSGTILVLEKLAGEPVEIVVNDKLIAKGEVIQIDDNYGVRITEIINRNKSS